MLRPKFPVTKLLKIVDEQNRQRLFMRKITDLQVLIHAIAGCSLQ